MNEMLLQFIWHQQLYDPRGLATTRGMAVEVLDPGVWNRNQGPDFLHARIRMDGRVWAGHVELHLQARDWQSHGHHQDSNYDNVVLHVVWEDDGYETEGIPVAELRRIVPQSVLHTYNGWTWKQALIPCASELPALDPGIIRRYIQVLAEERFMDKAGQVFEKVQAVGMDWQEAFWRGMARSFGHKVNADAFESIASSLPYSLLLKVRSQPLQLEALLMGQAGLLHPDNGDTYAKQLLDEFGFLRKKFRLSKSYYPVHFLRMRPINFPTIRLAQLAMLVHELPDLFRMVKEWKDPAEIMSLLRVGTTPYWDDHYRFSASSIHLPKLIGEQLIRTIMVNTIIPFMLAYHRHIGQEGQVEAVLAWTQQLPAEMNHIVHAFSRAGVSARHLKDAQGLLALHGRYCEKSKCAECAIGKWHLKTSCRISHHLTPHPNIRP